MACRDLGDDAIRDVQRLLHASIKFGLDHGQERSSTPCDTTVDLDRGQADEFVGMYVNDWTLDFGRRALEAVSVLPSGTNPACCPGWSRPSSSRFRCTGIRRFSSISARHLQLSDRSSRPPHRRTASWPSWPQTNRRPTWHRNRVGSCRRPNHGVVELLRSRLRGVARAGHRLEPPGLLQSVLEINTDVCESVNDAERDLRGRIRRGSRRRQAGLARGGAASVPFALCCDQRMAEDRYVKLVDLLPRSWPAAW